MTKKELIKTLVDNYGYEENDIKLHTNAKLEGMIRQEELDREQLENDKTAIVETKQRFKDEDLIMVMNGLEGTLIHSSTTTGRMWRFEHFGQTDKIPYGELLSLRNRSSSVFTDGWIVILNRQVQEEFGLTDLYKNVLTPDNIDSIFNKDIDELEAIIDTLPKGMKTTFVSKARELYRNNKLDSKRVIDFIEGKFNISLDDNAPLSDTV